MIPEHAALPLEEIRRRLATPVGPPGLVVEIPPASGRTFRVTLERDESGRLSVKSAIEVSEPVIYREVLP